MAPPPRRRQVDVLSALHGRLVLAFALGITTLAASLPVLAESRLPPSLLTRPGEPELEALDESADHARELVANGQRFETGSGGVRDLATAYTLYCTAARWNHADAFVRLGWMYAHGRGVARDDAIAASLFRRAAALGGTDVPRLGEGGRNTTDKLPDCLRDPSKGVTIAEAMKATPIGETPKLAAPATFPKAPPTLERRQLAETVVRLARDFRLDPRLVFAIIQVESNFDAQARSPKNAQGLMQLIPETALRFQVKDVLDPADNIRGGMGYLRWLLAYFRGDVVLAVAAYNAGEANVDRHRGVPPFAETLAYVQRVRSLYPLDRHGFDPKAAAPSSMFATSETRVPAGRANRATTPRADSRDPNGPT